MDKLKKAVFGIGTAICLCVAPLQVMASEGTLIQLADEVPIRVTVDKVSYIEKKGTLSDIIIEERKIGCLTSGQYIKERTLVLSLKGSKYNFTNLPTIKTMNGFEGLNVRVSYGEAGDSIDKQVIHIKLPKEKNATSRGKLIISGLKVETSTVSTGDISLNIGLLSEDTMESIKVAKAVEYGAVINTTRLVNVVAGDNRMLNFELEETLPDSLVSEGTIEVSLDKGYFRENNKKEIQIGAVLLNGRDVTNQVKLTAQRKEEQITGFDVKLPSLDSTRSNTIEFRGLQLCANSSDKGDITLTVEGKGIPKPVSEVVGEITKGSTFSVTPTKGQLGVKNQKGGAIIITENKKGMLNKGSIFIRFDGEPYVMMSKKPTLIIDGDIEAKVVGWKGEKDNVLEIRVTKTSKEASTIKLCDINFSVDRMAPDGTFDVEIGGDALWPETPDTMQNLGGFITISGEDTEIDDFPVNPSLPPEIEIPTFSQTTVFTLGETVYTVNGKEYSMEGAKPFIADGRTMVPIRYAAHAAGIATDDVGFSKGIISIPGKKLVEMEIGSRIIKVDGQLKTMVTAPIAIGGRTYVPISEIANVLDLEIKWDKVAKTATFTRK